MNNRVTQRGDSFFFSTPKMIASVIAITLSGASHGMDINVGNPDFTVSLDNTIRYNTGVRVQQRDSIIGNTASSDEGDYSHGRGDVVTNRLDLLSELQADYRGKMGFRLSGAAWYDAAFNNEVKTNPALSTRGSYTNNQFSDFTKRYYGGPSGELLEAFVYGKFKLGDMPASINIGRHTVLWGEAIALSTHSVSYSQAPTDARKAVATPGVDAKETALPIGQVSGTLQVTPELNLAGQYYYEWAETRVPEGGTYLAGTDFIFRGPNQFSLAPGVSLRNAGILKPRGAGDWGVGARWSPDWLGGTVGFYARQFTERNFWLSLDPAAGVYRAVFAQNTKLYGISLAKNFSGVSTGMEFSYRQNTALNSSISNGALQGAVGDTLHVLFNGVANYGNTSFWSSSAITAELAYSRLLRVTANRNLFNDCSSGTGRSVITGCSTQNALQAFLRFSPSWVGVQPGVDISALASISYGLKGNSPVLSGGNLHAGSYSIGGTLDYNTRHQFSLTYNGYLASYQSVNGTTIASSNGSQIQDRGWLSFTYKTSF